MGKGRQPHYSPYYTAHRVGANWSRAFCVLGILQTKAAPRPPKRVELALNNLGETRLEFPRDANGAQVDKMMVKTFPCLAGCFELLRNSESRGKELMILPMPNNGFSVDYLKTVLGQAKGFLWPLQNNIVLQCSTGSGN